jgi:hypothetical protein
MCSGPLKNLTDIRNLVVTLVKSQIREDEVLGIYLSYWKYGKILGDNDRERGTW